MRFHKILAAFVIVAISTPVWSATETLGNVTSSNFSTIRATPLTPGSTVFSGDAISVDQNGQTNISFNNGAKAEVLGNSVIKLSKEDNKVQMAVEHGQASFRSVGNDIEGSITDVTIRAADGAETSAIIRVLSDKHAVISAQKGALLVTTAYNDQTYRIPEGKEADLSAGQDQGGAIPAGQAAPQMHRRKKFVIWFIIIGGTGAGVTAYLLERRETSKPVQNEVSPLRLN